MQNNYLVPSLTNEGISMLVRCMDGGTIQFTKFVLGDGTPNDTTNMIDLANPKLEIGIIESEKRDGYLLLTGYCNSTQIEEAFYAKELGIFAQDESGNEKMYAYKYSDSEVDFFPSKNSGRTLEVTLSVIAQIGTAENVSAILIENDAYASKTDFKKHCEASNPHNTTVDDIGAAPASHKHNAADIDGILPVAHGGTGVSTYEQLAQKLNGQLNTFGVPQLGVFTGNGNPAREIHLGFKPKAVLLCDNYGNMHDDINGYIGGIAIGKYGCCSQRGSVKDAESWNSNYTTLMITNDGFLVNYYPANKVLSNENGRSYRFIAFR